MEENKEAYSHIDGETKDMLEVVANIRIPEKFKTDENGEERYNMCKAFEDMRLEGYEAGITAGRMEGIAAGMATGRAEGIAIEMASGIEKLVKTVRDIGASKMVACSQLIQKYSLNENEANEKIELYWAD